MPRILARIDVGAVFAAALMLSACATTPTAPLADPHRYMELVPGTSTRDEAVTKLGPPNSVAAVRDKILLQWIDVYSSHPIHLAILFGPDGRMIGVQSVFQQ